MSVRLVGSSHVFKNNSGRRKENFSSTDLDWQDVSAATNFVEIRK
jgi:hypothetical protein